MGNSGDFQRLGELLGDEDAGALWRRAGVDGSEREEGGAARPSPAGTGPAEGARSATGSDTAKLLAALWPELVGSEVAANAQPVQLRNGRLVVSASSASWAQTLQLMSVAILARIVERLGEGVVEKVTFQHAGWQERPRGRPGERRPSAQMDRGPTAEFADAGGRAGPTGEHDLGALSPEQKSVLTAIQALDLSPALREKVERAVRAAFVRAQREIVR